MHAEGLRTWGYLSVFAMVQSYAIYLRSPQVLLAVEVHNKHIGGLHKLFLYATRRNVYLVFMAYARSSASACHLAESPC